MRNRRRRPRVVWLPPDANNRIGANPATTGSQAGAFDFFIDILGPGSVAGDHAAGLVPINADIPTAEFQTGGLAVTSLADIESSGYRLRRVVGKLWVSLFQNATAIGDIPQVMVTAGLIVLRVDQAGIPLAVAATTQQYSPANINSWADPWMWRRSWMLSNFAEATAVGLPLFPDTNTNAPGTFDGPHVDAKVARRIGPEERLFLVADAMVVKAGDGGSAHVSIQGDLRCVASVLNMAGNRRNASR